MVLIKIPLRLRWLVYSLALCIPLIAFEIALVSRAPTWDLPWQRMAYGSIAFGLLSIPMMAWFLSLHRWVWYLASFLASVWVFFSFLLSVRMGFPNLTFFTLFLSLLLLCQLFLLSREMNQSFLYPGVRWYQGVPEFIPQLRGQIKLSEGDSVLEVRVSRLDSRGVFLFPVFHTEQTSQGIRGLLKRERCELILQFRHLQLRCEAQPVAFLSRGDGIGLQWRGLDLDLSKDLADFQEQLRGEGYV